MLSFRARVAPSYEWVPEGEVRLWSEIRELGEEMGRNYSFGLVTGRGTLCRCHAGFVLKPVDNDRHTRPSQLQRMKTQPSFATLRRWSRQRKGSPHSQNDLDSFWSVKLQCHSIDGNLKYVQMRFLIGVWMRYYTKDVFLQTHFSELRKDDSAFHSQNYCCKYPLRAEREIVFLGKWQYFAGGKAI